MSLSRAPVLRDPFSARCAAIGRRFIVIAAAFTTVSMSLSAVATPAVAAGHGTLDLGTLRGYTGSDAVAVNDTGLVVADSSSEHEASQHSSTPSSVLRTTTNKLSPKGEGFFVKTYHDYSLASAGSGEYSSIAYGDLRSDGRKDLVVGGKSGVNVLLSNGNGTFRPAVAYDTSHKYYNVAVADLNGDGHPDIVATNYPSNTVTILFGRGNGTFRAPTVLTVAGAKQAISIAVGDLRHNGRTDFVVGTDSGIVPFLNIGKGQFSQGITQPYMVGSIPVSVGSGAELVIGDVARDGYPDIVTGDIFHEGGGFCGSCSGVDFFTNNKMGSFDRAQYIAFGNDYESWGRVILADVNGDGRPSLISLDGAGCGYDNPGTFEVALNNGAGGFSSPGPGEGPSCAGDIAAEDINGDGITDITSLSGPSVAGGPGTGIVSLGNGDGKFVSLPPPIERSANL